MIGYPAIDDINGLSAVKEEQNGSYQDYYRPGYPVYRGQRSKSRMGREEDPRSPAGYEAWTEYYERQLSVIRRANEDTEAYFAALLADYFDTVPHKATKTQESYSLPSCKLVLKAQQPEFNRDETVLCDYLDKKGRDDLVRITRRADWAALKKTLKVMEDGTCVDADGEVVEGVQAFSRLPEFKIEMKEDNDHE